MPQPPTRPRRDRFAVARTVLFVAIGLLWAIVVIGYILGAFGSAGPVAGVPIEARP